MSAKLTLSINEKTIELAKQVSRKKGKSLSKMVEDYLNTMVEKEELQEPIIDKIKKIVEPYLSNIVIPADGDYTKQVREWQVEDYFNKSAGQQL